MTRLVLVVGLLGACGSVATRSDAAAGSDSTVTDGATDTMMIDAAVGPPAQLRWNFESNLVNSGAMNGYAFTAPAGSSYAAGKIGMGASFGSGQYLSVSGMKGVLGTFSKVTIALWLKEPGNLASLAILDDLNRAGNAPWGGIQFGFSTNLASICVATTTEILLGGGCDGPAAPSANVFHHWIFRYDGTGLAAGQGAAVEVYVDGVLAHTRANPSSNPVFTSAIPDNLYVGAPGTVVDDVRIYNQVFSVADQCTFIIGGTYAGSTCTLP